MPAKYRAIYFLNPITGLLEAFRWSLLNKCDVSVSYIWYAAAATGVVFVFGAVAFKRMERRFADVI